jgi:hypothetical protein
MTDTLKFKKAITVVTHKIGRSTTEAMKPFKDVVREGIRRTRQAAGRTTSPETIERILQECLDVWREKGMEFREVLRLARLYDSLPRRKQRKKRKESSCGDSDAPKMSKTPHDDAKERVVLAFYLPKRFQK